MFNERETFVMMMTAMITSEQAKKYPRDVRQKLLAFLRDKYCSTVNDEQWAEIAKDINTTKETLMQETMKYMVSSMHNDGSMQEDKAAMELEKTVQEHKDEIDLDKLKEATPDIGVKETIDEIKEAKTEENRYGRGQFMTSSDKSIMSNHSAHDLDEEIKI